jgi:hypothetical protein
LKREFENEIGRVEVIVCDVSNWKSVEEVFKANESSFEFSRTSLVRFTRKAFRLIEKKKRATNGMGLDPKTKENHLKLEPKNWLSQTESSNFYQEFSPGVLMTEVIRACGASEKSDEFLQDHDVAQAVNFLLMTDYSVNTTEIAIKGEIK